MILFFDPKTIKNESGYRISGYPDIHPHITKRGQGYIAEKKVIFDHLRISDNQKFHFRMLFSFIFYIINIYSKKTEKTQNLEAAYQEKMKKDWISGYPDIRYPGE